MSAEFRRGMHFRDGKLIHFEPNRVTVMRAAPIPRAYRKGRRGGWRHVRPDLKIRLLEHSASGAELESFLGNEFVVKGQRIVRPVPLQRHLPFALTSWERFEAGLTTKREAARRFLETIPPAVRAVVRRFQSRQWHMLVFLIRAPGADELVATNPALSAAIASNWVFHRPAVRQPVRAMRRLVRIRRRQACAWLGFPSTEAAVRVLGRVVAADASIPLLLDIRRAVHDEESRELLGHLRRPTRGALTLLTSPETRPHITVPLLEDVSGDREWARGLRAFGTLRDTLEMARRLDRPLPRFRSRAQLVRWHDRLVQALQISKEIARYLRYTFPPPPLPGTDTIVPLTTPDALIEEGRIMDHCVATRTRDVARGKAYIYAVHAPVRATLEIQPMGTGWGVVEIQGTRNRVIDYATLEAVGTWLVAVHDGQVS